MGFELTEQRKEVLRAIAETKESIHGSELARILEKTPMAVHKNIQPFLEEKILKSELTYEGGKRLYQFTDKGTAYVLVHTDIDVDTLLWNHRYLATAAQRDELKLLLKDKAVRNTFYKTVAKYLLDNNLFDEDGNPVIDKPENKQKKLECAIDAHKSVYTLYRRHQTSINNRTWRIFLTVKFGISVKQLDAVEQLVNVVENPLA